ncbi:hypothetical protein VM1G_03387 [Cytospora mali]|uniref:Uncharacterized protein n=1 Tax=Cytospora mali TaxID=578113 RepID=A0A194VUW8_CYTMA|nr:hypothetical protein VM1G_03387 [Valsa mali]
MSWDSKSNLPRRSRGLSLRQAARAATQPTAPIKIDPKSAHTSDPFLQSFLNPAFDPAEHLNAALPPLQGSSSSLRSSSLPSAAKTSVPLAQLSSEAQDLLTQLNAHTTRLTNTLTQLTDDILRSGSRLAYEVELLRGETLGLAETLADEGPLREDLERFVPAGARAASHAPPPPSASARRASLVSAHAPAAPLGGGGGGGGGGGEKDSPVPVTPATAVEKKPEDAAGVKAGEGQGQGQGEGEPQYISQLRTLTLVRSRLDSVIKTFGDAMEFTFPPSEFSVSSGFLSVSAPDFPDMHSATREQISTEEKGQQVLRKIRDEVSGLLARGNPQPVKGVEDATRRVEELKELAGVWKGTAEEKGRQRFVENLARMVEDRHRELVREAEMAREQALRESRSRQDDGGGSRRDQGGSSEATATESKGLGGYGFMKKWQDLRGGL